MATTYLESDFTGTGSSSAAIATYSVWVKLALSDTRATIIGAMDDVSNYLKIRLADDGAGWYMALYGVSPSCDLRSSRLFRDPAGWYNIVMAFDTAQAVDTNRIKVWVNGVQITSWSTATYLAENDELFLTKSDDLQIGAFNNTEHFDGLMTHFHCVDGTAYDATAFGEFDATSGIWKIKTSPSVTYGTKGYFILEDGAGLTDQSGNSNNFTLGAGTLTATKDNPSNNFATWNPLHNTGATMSNGNTTALSTDANFIAGVSTLGVAAGKWYSEFKLNAEGASGESVIGVTALVRPTSAIAGQTGNFGMRNDNGTIYYTSGGSATTDTSQHSDFTTSDIIGVALDMDLGRLYFSKNGGWWNGAATWGAATPSSYITLQTDIYDEFFFEGGDAAGSQDASWQANFGNGYFGTTAVSSAQADDAGIGAMEYDVPAGYYCLCTKNIKAYGG
jgi:hypothetical protein